MNIINGLSENIKPGMLLKDSDGDIVVIANINPNKIMTNLLHTDNHFFVGINISNGVPHYLMNRDYEILSLKRSEIFTIC